AQQRPSLLRSMRLSCCLLLVVLAPLRGFLLDLLGLRGPLLLGTLRLLAHHPRGRLAGLRELQDGVLEELHQTEHRRGLRRIERLGAHDQLFLIFRAVELGEIFSARLVQYELDAKLGHWCSSSSRDNSE